MKERYPAIYAKYGPFVTFGDVDDAEWAAITVAVEQAYQDVLKERSIFTKRCARCNVICDKSPFFYCSLCFKTTRYCSRDCVKKDWREGHKARCAEINREGSQIEEQALSAPKFALAYKSLLTWNDYSSDQLARAAYSSTGILSDPPNSTENILVFSLIWHPEQADPSLSFTLHSATDLTPADAFLRFRLPDKGYSPIETPRDGAIGTRRVILTTSDSARSEDEIVTLGSTLEFIQVPPGTPDWEECNDADWKSNLARRLKLSHVQQAEGAPRGITPRMMDDR
ncbi:hypothetical protein RQP46_004639 [Phenoliferia psychrophenolica]